MTFFHVPPHFISFTNRNNKSAFSTNSFRAFWPNRVVNGLVLILSEPTLTWSSPQNTNGKHFDQSYIFRLNILSLWYLHQVLSSFGQSECWLSTLSSGVPMIMWWYMAQIAALDETWSPLLLWIAYPLLFAYSLLLGR